MLIVTVWNLWSIANDDISLSLISKILIKKNRFSEHKDYIQNIIIM